MDTLTPPAHSGIHVEVPVMKLEEKKPRQTRQAKHEAIERQKHLLYVIISAKEGLNYEQIAAVAEMDKCKVAPLLTAMKQEKVIYAGERTKTSKNALATTFYIVKKKNFWDRVEEFLSFKWLKK